MSRTGLAAAALVAIIAIIAVAAGLGVIAVGLETTASTTSSQSSASSSLTTSETISAPTSAPTETQTTGSASASNWAALYGSWTAYSTAFYYDAGGGGASPVATYTLNLNPDGTWSYGTSHGTWAVGTVTGADWVRWHNTPQSNMTQKIVLNGWDANGTKGIGDGPLQYSASVPSRIDFVWIMFHVGPPITAYPGEVYFKFGHSNLNG